MAAKPKLTREQVAAILESQSSNRVLAKTYGVWPRAIQKIRDGLTHKIVIRELRRAA